jgi:hypothetical protein
VIQEAIYLADIDAAGAAAAIDAAGGLNTLMGEGSGAEPTPSATPGSTPNVSSPVTPTLAEQAAQPVLRQEQTTETERLGQFDRNSVPAELRPILDAREKEMLADYTRKTQQVAPWRQVAEEVGVDDPAVLKQAYETYQMLQDPSQWVGIHKELTSALEEMGLSPAQASEAATQQLEGQSVQQQTLPGQQTPAPLNLDAMAQDPELAPVANYLKSLEGQVTNLNQELTNWKSQQEQEMIAQAFIGEVKRQENVLRSLKGAGETPKYADDDIGVIYDWANAYDGNLLEAAKKYDQFIANKMETWINSKTAASGAPGISPSGAETITAQPNEYAPKTLESPEVDAAVKEYITQMEAAGGI